MNNIEVVNLTPQSDFADFDAGKIRKTANNFLLFLGKKNCGVIIFLGGGQLMKELNRKFRKRKKAADILSFPEPQDFPHPESKLKFLGEIYLNADSLKASKINLLLVHGLLHLFGFQHHKKSDRVKMETWENRILESQIFDKMQSKKTKS